MFIYRRWDSQKRSVQELFNIRLSEYTICISYLLLIMIINVSIINYVCCMHVIFIFNYNKECMNYITYSTADEAYAISKY